MLIALLAQVTLAQVLEPEMSSPQLRRAIPGVCIMDGQGKELFGRNADTLLMPASNQKLLTVAYALARLGPQTRFETKIWKHPMGWYVDAPGHPDLTYAQIVGAREQLRIAKGSTILVRQPFRPEIPPGWEWDDLPNKYAAKPGALTVDRGSFELWANKGRLTLRPANYGVVVKKMGGKRRRLTYDFSNRVIRVWGPVPSAPARIDTLAVPEPDEAAASVFGGKLVPTEEPPPPEGPALVLQSAPLIEIATACLQDSDNNLAENLLLMAAAKEGPLGDEPYETAAARLTEFLLEDVGFEKGSVRPVDGSGLSRHNLITPRSLVKILTHARTVWGDLWSGALAAPGNGTLKQRLIGSPFKGKTGSLNSVQAISGYSVDGQANPLVIVLVFNNTTSPASEIRAIQDAIVRKIESYRDGTDIDAYDHREGRNPHQSHPALYRHRGR